MDNDGSTLERLRQRLADLESAQRASGGTACPEFWRTPNPRAARSGSSGAAGPSALAPTLAFVAGITALPDLVPIRLHEADLVESATQLGLLQRHKEVVLLRVVTELECRGAASPGGLSRVDWLRSVDPTLTVTAAKAVVTCAAAFNQLRWQTLYDAVVSPSTEHATDDAADSKRG